MSDINKNPLKQLFYPGLGINPELTGWNRTNGDLRSKSDKQLNQSAIALLKGKTVFICTKEEKNFVKIFQEKYGIDCEVIEKKDNGVGLKMKKALINERKATFINDLQLIGFIDVNEDKNGGAYRKNIPGTSLELCFYINEDHIRLQTQGSGYTLSLDGVNDLTELNQFCKLLFNKSVLEF